MRHPGWGHYHRVNINSGVPPNYQAWYSGLVVGNLSSAENIVIPFLLSSILVTVSIGVMDTMIAIPIGLNGSSGDVGGIAVFGVLIAWIERIGVLMAREIVPLQTPPARGCR